MYQAAEIDNEGTPWVKALTAAGYMQQLWQNDAFVEAFGIEGTRAAWIAEANYTAAERMGHTPPYHIDMPLVTSHFHQADDQLDIHLLFDLSNPMSVDDMIVETASSIMTQGYQKTFLPAKHYTRMAAAGMMGLSAWTMMAADEADVMTTAGAMTGFLSAGAAGMGYALDKKITGYFNNRKNTRETIRTKEALRHFLNMAPTVTSMDKASIPLPEQLQIKQSALEMAKRGITPIDPQAHNQMKAKAAKVAPITIGHPYGAEYY